MLKRTTKEGELGDSEDFSSEGLYQEGDEHHTIPQTAERLSKIFDPVTEMEFDYTATRRKRGTCLYFFIFILMCGCGTASYFWLQERNSKDEIETGWKTKEVSWKAEQEKMKTNNVTLNEKVLELEKAIKNLNLQLDQISMVKQASGQSPLNSENGDSEIVRSDSIITDGTESFYMQCSSFYGALAPISIHSIDEKQLVSISMIFSAHYWI